MAISPAPGWLVDPNNPNAVIPDPNAQVGPGGVAAPLPTTPTTNSTAAPTTQTPTTATLSPQSPAAPTSSTAAITASPQDQQLLALGVSPTDLAALNDPSGNGLDPASFQALIGNIETKLKTNNDLVTQRGYLIKQLYDSPLTPDELSKLPPDLQSVVGQGKDATELQLRLLNDQIAGRSQTLNQSIGYLTQGYTTASQQLIDQRNAAIANVQNFVQQYGNQAPAALKALYGQSYLDQLKAEGIDINAFAMVSPQTITQQRYIAQYGSGVSSGSAGYDLTTYATDPNYTQKVDSIAQGIGSILSPDQAQAYISANYPNSPVTGTMVMQAANQYGVDPATIMAIMQQETQMGTDGSKGALQDNFGNVGNTDSVMASGGSVPMGTPQDGVNAIAQWLAGHATQVNPSTLQGMLSYYQTTGKIPAMGLGVNSPLRKAFWTAVGTQGQTFVSQAQANAATFSAMQGALKTQQTQYSAAQTSIGTIDQQLQLVQKYSDQLSRTDSPLANQYLLYIKGQVQGDVDTQNLQNIVQTASYEFAKILSGSSASIAGVTVTSAQDAQNLLNANMTNGQLTSIIGLMKQESEFRLSSQQDSISTLQQDMQSIGATDGTTDTSGTGTGAGTTNSDPMNLGI